MKGAESGAARRQSGPHCHTTQAQLLLLKDLAVELVPTHHATLTLPCP